VATVEPGADNEFFTEFLDDYFAECDEHLTAARHHLLALDRSIGQPQLDRATLDDLFRSFHSLKGISGMVGVREAEQLAHEMESYLRALRDRQIQLSTEGMDVLIAGTRLMEQVVAARRAQAAAPDIATVLKQLEAIVSGHPDRPAQVNPASAAHPSGHALNADEAAQLEAATAEGKRVWRFEFVPVAELAGRGINVNIVRARLQETGELIHAAPRVMAHGGIAFDFLLATSADESIFAGWSDDGLTYTAYEPPAPIPPEDRRVEDVAEEVTSAPPTTRAPSSVVRVDLGRLDELMRMVGDLVISRSRLDEHLRHIESTMPAAEWRHLQETNLMMERQLRDLREGVMRVRMVPVGEIFERMRFVVRDLAREYNKQVALELSGQHTEIDKLLVERMMDPILHLARNAVSHGLESADERAALGKPPVGRIALRAWAVAESIVIEIEDDGRGIDAGQVARRAQALGMIRDDATIDNATLLDLICAPGFSTRDEADRASGRGVGMNVVKNTILGIGGSFELDTEVGRGTRFTIQLPLTLAIADALIVAAGGQRFAVPLASVREVIEVEPSAVRAFENNEVIVHRGGVLPLMRLARLFRLTESSRRGFHAFVIGSGLNAVGVAVDRVLGQREIVVRAINDPLIQVAGIAGATELGDGRIVLILDAATLGRASQAKSASHPKHAEGRSE
jgi:two-component system chemotaxis sensor kinase CheA